MKRLKHGFLLLELLLAILMILLSSGIVAFYHMQVIQLQTDARVQLIAMNNADDCMEQCIAGQSVISNEQLTIQEEQLWPFVHTKPSWLVQIVPMRVYTMSASWQSYKKQEHKATLIGMTGAQKRDA